MTDCVLILFYYRFERLYVVRVVGNQYALFNYNQEKMTQ